MYEGQELTNEGQELTHEGSELTYVKGWKTGTNVWRTRTKVWRTGTNVWRTGTTVWRTGTTVTYVRQELTYEGQELTCRRGTVALPWRTWRPPSAWTSRCPSLPCHRPFFLSRLWDLKTNIIYIRSKQGKTMADWTCQSGTSEKNHKRFFICSSKAKNCVKTQKWKKQKTQQKMFQKPFPYKPKVGSKELFTITKKVNNYTIT